MKSVEKDKYDVILYKDYTEALVTLIALKSLKEDIKNDETKDCVDVINNISLVERTVNKLIKEYESMKWGK